MSIPRSVLFALLSLGFLAVSAYAQNADASELEKLLGELPGPVTILPPKDFDRLYQEARDFLKKGKYHEAKASMTRAYEAFERLEVKNKAKHIGFLRRLSNVSIQLQENDKTIEYATEVAVHALKHND